MDYSKKLFNLKSHLKLNHLNEVNPDVEAITEHTVSKTQLPLLNILKKQLADSSNNFEVRNV